MANEPTPYEDKKMPKLHKLYFTYDAKDYKLSKAPISILNKIIKENNQRTIEVVLRDETKTTKTLAQVAKQEITRRTACHTNIRVDLTGHAIDRVSQNFHKIYMEDRRPVGFQNRKGVRYEGLYSWILRSAVSALEHGQRKKTKDSLEVKHKKMKWVFRPSKKPYYDYTLITVA